jgi:hypothetical protein
VLCPTLATASLAAPLPTFDEARDRTRDRLRKTTGKSS